tara:strand:+ start:1316 stop:1477 length:162 start_codon:yes stop_codon:yes gene_type:complete
VLLQLGEPDFVKGFVESFVDSVGDSAGEGFLDGVADTFVISIDTSVRIRVVVG